MPKCSSLFWKYGTTEWKAVRTGWIEEKQRK